MPEIVKARLNEFPDPDKGIPRVLKATHWVDMFVPAGIQGLKD